MLVEDKIPDQIVFVSTTCEDATEARAIALAAINERLAVCGDYSKIESIYPWEGSIEEVDEYNLVLTTQKSLAHKLVDFVKGMHSYSIPMIAVTDVSFMHPLYSFWVQRTLEGAPPTVPDVHVNKIQSADIDDGYEVGKLK